MTALPRIRSAVISFTHSVLRRTSAQVDARDDAIRELEALVRAQSRRIEEIAAAQVELPETIVDQIEKTRLPKSVWFHVSYWIAATAGIVVLSAIIGVQASILNGQAAALSEQSQFESLQSSQILLPVLNAIEQSGGQALISHASMYLANAKTAKDLALSANRDSNQANRLGAVAADYQTYAQIGLALGSAFLGAVLGWIVTQFLAVRHRRHAKHFPAAAASAFGGSTRHQS